MPWSGFWFALSCPVHVKMLSMRERRQNVQAFCASLPSPPETRRGPSLQAIFPMHLVVADRILFELLVWKLCVRSDYLSITGLLGFMN